MVFMAWHTQNQKGNSNTTERIELMQEINTLFPEREIAYLTADLEFLGHDWFRYLLKQPTVPFVSVSAFESVIA